MTTAAIRWEDPPRQPGQFDHVLDAVQAEPGRWASWPGSVSAGTKLRQAGYEFLIRTVDTPEGRRQKGWIRWPAAATNGDAKEA